MSRVPWGGPGWPGVACIPRVDGELPAVRLPTEAEWEFAARGGLAVTPEQFAASRYPMTGAIEAHAWVSGNARGDIQPIGQLEPNPLGLHDVYGNVAEMTADIAIGETRYGRLPVFTLRGGSRYSSAAELGSGARQQASLYDERGQRVTSDAGFRLVVGVPLLAAAAARDAERGGRPEATKPAAATPTLPPEVPSWLPRSMAGLLGMAGLAVAAGITLGLVIGVLLARRRMPSDSAGTRPDASETKPETAAGMLPEPAVGPSVGSRPAPASAPQPAAPAKPESGSLAPTERSAEPSGARLSLQQGPVATNLVSRRSPMAGRGADAAAGAGSGVDAQKWAAIERRLAELNRAGPGERPARGRSAGAEDLGPGARELSPSTRDDATPGSRKPGSNAGGASGSGSPAGRLETNFFDLDGLELDLDDLDLSGPRPAGSALPMDTSALDLDLDLEGLSDLCDDAAAPAALPRSGLGLEGTEQRPEPDSWNEAETKLDLARAYLAMDDAAAARVILEDVMREGSDTQRAAAEQLLAALG
jgi:FimV-like protein